MGAAIRVLQVEDMRTDVELVLRELTRAGFRIDHRAVSTEAALREQLTEFRPDIILSDFSMPRFDGLAALRVAREASPHTPFIFFSGNIGEEQAIQAMRNGATDYVLKVNLARLPAAVERALKDAQRHSAKQEIEAGLHRAQLMAKLGHVVTGPDGAFESWSESLPGLVGVDEARMPRSTRGWLDLVHPEDRDLLRATSIDAGRRGERREVGYRVRRGDGAWIHVRQTIEPLAAAPGRAAGERWFNTLQDVSTQEQVEGELRRFRAAMDISGDAILLIDRGSMRYVDVNQTFCELVGYAREEVLGMTPMDLFSAERGTLERDYDAIIADNSSAASKVEGHYRRKDGTRVPIETRRRALRTKDGWIIVGTARDITERKEAEAKIARLNRVYAVLSGINAAIVRIRERGELFSEATRIAVEHGGLASAWMGVVDREKNEVNLLAWHGCDEDFVKSLRGRTSMRMDPAGAAGIVVRAVTGKVAVVSNDVANDARVTLREDLNRLGIRSLAVLPIVVGGETAAVLTLHAGEKGYFDEQEMKLLLELAGDIAFALDHIDKANRLDYLAYYDSLTGLANRSLLLERLNQGIHAASLQADKVALVLADVERFGTVNESLGRQAGDVLLQQLAERLALAAGRGEIARIGADHFAIVFQGIKGKSEVTRRVERTWQACFGEPLRVGEAEVRVSARAGAALFPNDGADADTLLRNAEAALRRGKETGERLVFHAAEMTARTGEKLTLETSLRRALDNGEFVLHYQPKVDLATGRIAGVEALMRWQSPELGLVPPGRFVPLMEETGLILPAGAWALGQASADHRRWAEQGLKSPRIAVNVSPIQLRQRDFVATVQQAIGAGGLPIGIDLEITESLIMEDIQGNIDKLQAVRRLGVSIAIDDFGTGYSSLAYLARLPIQTLKIDRSFIITMLNNSNTMTLVQTIISLAHSLKLKVVAEGVDEDEQAKVLRLLRCDEMQGYLFSRPVPFEEMTALLKRDAAAGAA